MKTDESDPRALAYVYQHQDTCSLFYIRTANRVPTRSTACHFCAESAVNVFEVQCDVSSVSIRRNRSCWTLRRFVRLWTRRRQKKPRRPRHKSEKDHYNGRSFFFYLCLPTLRYISFVSFLQINSLLLQRDTSVPPAEVNEIPKSLVQVYH